MHIRDDAREKETLPKIVRLGDERLIKCYQHSITIDGLTSQCLREPFSLPVSMTIAIANVTHEFEQHAIKVNLLSAENRTVVKATVQETFAQAMK